MAVLAPAPLILTPMPPEIETPIPRRFCRLALVSLAILALLSFRSSRAENPEAAESKVKAAFLFNFAKFVHWNFPAADTPIMICVLGDSSFTAELESAVQGRTVEGHPIQVRHVPENAAIENCQILFVTASAKSRWSSLQRSVESKPILTVGEVEGFAARGGVVNFYKEKNHIRFEINPDAAQKAQLKISSRLLQLAKMVPSVKS